MAVTLATQETTNNINASMAGNIGDGIRGLADIVAAPWKVAGAVPYAPASTQTQGFSFNDTVHGTTRYVLVTVTAQETDGSYVAGNAIVC